MADSTDLNSNKKQNQLDAELDAILDEAALSLTSLDNREIDDDVIDRLLLDNAIDENDDLDIYAGIDDDFDPGDLQNDARLTDTDLTPSVEVEVDINDDFPLDLLDSIALPPDNKDTGLFNAMEEEEVSIVPLTEVSENEPLIDDISLSDRLDEFSDLNEFNDFQDFQQPFLVESDEPGTDLTLEAEQAEIIEPLDDPDFNNPEIGLIDDVAKLAAIDDAVEYDEFSDDFDENDESMLLSEDERVEENQLIPIEAAPDAELGNAISPDDFDITAGIDDDLIDSLDQDQEDELLSASELEASPADRALEKAVDHQFPELSPDMIAQLSELVGLPALMQFKSDQESFNKKNKKQIADLELQNKKSSTLTYVALGLAIASLIAVAVISTMFFQSKSEVIKLTEIVAALQTASGSMAATDIKLDEKNPANTPPDINVAEQDKHLQENPDPHVNETKPETVAVAKALEHEIAHKEPEHNVGKTEQPEPTASVSENEHLSNESVKVETPTPTPTSPSHETEKKSEAQHHPANEPPPITVAKPEASPPPTDVSKIHSPTKSENTQVNESKLLTVENAKNSVVEKKKAVNTSIKKSTTKHQKININTASATSDWSVNLIAYKQQWYATSKADEFKQKGIPVEIIPVSINKITWYRLRVGGFNDKNDASAYASRIKKALNLNSVWVGNK